jgi:ABC-type transporter Mla subunit MlaD
MIGDVGSSQPASQPHSESPAPSLVETLVRLPGALLRLPSATLDALDAMNDLADRLDRLMTMLEPFEGSVKGAGSGFDMAASGISFAVSGLEQAVGTLDSSLPYLSDSAAALRALTERLGGVAIELVTELPKATRSLQDVSPELSAVVGTLDERFTHLDDVVTELARLMEPVIDSIPGIRQVMRAAANAPIEPL